MSGPFQGSRLANLRQKKLSHVENVPVATIEQVQKPLTLMQDDDTSYQPSINIQGGRTATRFLKGRIQRPSGIDKESSGHIDQAVGYPNKENHQMQRKPSMKLSDPPAGQLKLVLNDSPQFEKKKIQVKPMPQAPQKRVLIQKKQEKQEPKPQVKQIPKQVKKQEPKQKAPVNPIEQQVIAVKPSDPNVIKQEDVEESKDVQENENELVECPQGCGRKFNRKALEKHAKACKLVFMSKRKEFNSEAKRLTSQEQAALVKQNKLQEKKAQMGMTKGKGFDKTSDNWKAASEDFRSAIKAIKKQGPEEQGKQEMKVIPCQYCEKPFAQVLLPKHLQNCVKKKEKQLKDKKKATKKK